MKKKIIVSISTILVLIVSAIALVACGAPNSLTKFVSKASTSDTITVEYFNAEGKLFQKAEAKGTSSRQVSYDEAGKVTEDYFVMIEGENSVMYVYTSTEEAKSSMEMRLEYILNRDIKEGATPIEVKLALNTWARFETGDAPDYSNDSAIYALPFNILDDECPKCVGKKVLEERFEKNYIEDDNKWYPRDSEDETKADKSEGYYTYEDGILSVYHKIIDTKFVKASTYKLSADNVKLPADAAKLKK